MDIFLTIRRQRTTILLDFKETTSVLDVKNALFGVTKMQAENMKLWNDPYGKKEDLDDAKLLTDYNITKERALAHEPYLLGMTYRQADGTFEPLVIEAYSTPPELPEVMRGNTSDTQPTSNSG